MKIPNNFPAAGDDRVSLARIVSEDSQPFGESPNRCDKSSKDS